MSVNHLRSGIRVCFYSFRIPHSEIRILEILTPANLVLEKNLIEQRGYIFPLNH
jgi:hypothetical protein